MLGEETLTEHEILDDLGASRPCKTLDFAFDFVEICGGSGVLSKAASKRGLRVCAPIELSSSPHFDITNPSFLDWIMQMIVEKRFHSLGLEPGFDRKNQRPCLGTSWGFRCLVICWFAMRHGAPSPLEQPRRSKTGWVAAWRYLAATSLWLPHACWGHLIGRNFGSRGG